MLGYIDQIKTISAKLLTQGKVDMVIGFRQGSVPMMNVPCMVKNPADLDKLVWDGHCGINLANYVIDRKEKIGIVAKGCDSRNLVNLMIENKIKREQLVIIGVPCKGMLDYRKIESNIVEEKENAQVLVKSGDHEELLERAALLQDNCSICIHHNPVIYDELVGTLVEEQELDRYAQVKKVEALSIADKWDYFETLLNPCIRCYACRNACPLCFCPTCFVDEDKPQWVGKGEDPTDARTFHFLRAYHCAGRCTDCGACVRACPMGIDVRAFTLKLEKDCFELWGWESGLSLDQRPALDVFKPDDPQDFIK